MSHITRGRKSSEDYQAYLDHLDDQYFKDNCPFGLTAEEKENRKKKKVKRKRKPMSKKGKLWKKK